MFIFHIALLYIFLPKYQYFILRITIAYVYMYCNFLPSYIYTISVLTDEKYWTEFYLCLRVRTALVSVDPWERFHGDVEDGPLGDVLVGVRVPGQRQGSGPEVWEEAGAGQGQEQVGSSQPVKPPPVPSQPHQAAHHVLSTGRLASEWHSISNK